MYKVRVMINIVVFSIMIVTINNIIHIYVIMTTIIIISVKTLEVYI